MIEKFEWELEGDEWVRSLRCGNLHAHRDMCWTAKQNMPGIIIDCPFK